MKAPARFVAILGSLGIARKRALTAVPVLVAALAIGAALVPAALADTPPSVTIDPPSSVSYTSAHLSGSVDPEGGPSNALWHFEYTAEEPTPETFWIQPNVDGEIVAPESEESNPITVADDFTSLLPGTRYFVRLVATNEDGANRVVSALEEFETAPVTPPTVTIDPVGAVTDTTAHFSGSVNPNAPGDADEPQDPAFNTSWSFECSPACPGFFGDNEGQVPADNDPQVVEFNPASLEPNLEYHVTLRATNAGGEASAEETFTTEAVAPTLTPRFASDLKTDGATLRAGINPHNDATTYRFEWGLDSNYGHTLPAGSEAAVIPTGNTPVTVSQTIHGGLEPDTTYHFRVIATNSVDTVEGPDQTFTTKPVGGAGFQLPDGRAYELVSPPNKNGADVLAVATRTRAATNGNAVAYASLGGFGEVSGTGFSVDYVATRGAGGWTTRGIMPLQEPMSGPVAFGGPGDPMYEWLAPDLSQGIVRTNPLPGGPANVAAVQSLYRRTDVLASGAGSYDLVSAAVAPIAAPYAGSPSGYKPFFAGASDDFRHVFFESSRNLTQDAIDAALPQDETNPGATPKLYEWFDGTVRFVGVLPPAEGGGLAPEAVAGAGASGINPLSRTNSAISADGSRIFFSTPLTGRLYQRADASETVRVNATEKDPPVGPEAPARFWFATRDGKHAFFTSEEQLTDDDGDVAPDLFRWDEEPDSTGRHLTRISTLAGISVTGAIGISNNGTRVYFHATTGTSGRVVYAWHDGEIKSVAELGLSAADTDENLDSGFVLTRLQSRVAPDGKHIVFTSFGQGDASAGSYGPTGYDHGVCDSAFGTCREVYVYSAEANGGAGELTCASCRVDGAPAEGTANLNVNTRSGGARASSYLNRPMTDDGRWIFFTSADALLPADRNDVNDVYRYEVSTHRLALITSGGLFASDSYFLDASPSGHDVFFTSRDRLVGWDTDSSYDLYDARVGGGFPEPPPLPPSCEGDACKGQIRAPSTSSSSPGSESTAGPLPPRVHRCPKGKRKVKSHGKIRCVKKNIGNRANNNRRTSR